jgi:hypothetical protein
VQWIGYAETETNYCPRCQTGGKLLADRGLSRLLRGDWPKTKFTGRGYFGSRSCAAFGSACLLLPQITFRTRPRLPEKIFLTM